jgi:ATP-dependent Lhr-like helicase
LENKKQERNSLSVFDPIIAKWFCAKYAYPTDIQNKAWPIIASGQHTLVCAPTGTGKTLTAFLWAINQLINGSWEPGTVRVLYISPLKALNTDIRENLISPLDDLKKQFLSENIRIPEIRIQTRSGDTSSSERRTMLKRPPEILITTPESLNLIISSPIARKMLTGLKTVILDEIHAVASTKRGSFLMTAIERLELLSKGFQRIALSATVRPLETIAAFVGGFEMVIKKERNKELLSYSPRPVQIVSSTMVKKIRITVEGIHFNNIDAESNDDVFWHTLASRIRTIIGRNSSTVVFVNNRRLAERLTLYINENCESPLAYSHHGSLSKELRMEVEQKLKAGVLKAIVATSTLEMGIDVGAIDEVILVGTPLLVSSALQRIGRAGHSVLRTSCGTLMPLHGLDFLYAATMASLSVNGDIEEIRPVHNPLDVLAQMLIAMVGVESWDIDDLYRFIRTASPYSTLPRFQFDNIISMLTGKYQESRIRDLKPRILFDSSENRLYAHSNALKLIYNNAGTIPDRGYYGLRLKGTSSLIGELDEEFVWERRIGDTFLLGTQRWQITDIGSKDVEVVPWHGSVSMSPFWKADAPNRSFHVSKAILEFLEQWNDHIGTPQFIDELKKHCYLDDTAAEYLSTFLQLQKAFTGPVLPHRHQLIVEHVHDSENGSEPYTLLHTLWGNPVNYPFMLAFQTAYEKRNGRHIEMSSSNDIIYISTIVAPEDIRMLLFPEELEKLLRENLERSNYFGARFRENAGRALLLPRFNRMKRMPLWLTRERSKRLFDAVRKYDDFPLLVETWRSCLTDDFDLNALKMLIDELRSGSIDITAVNTSKVSPFCNSMKWQVTNTKLYQDDTPYQAGASSVNPDIIKSVVHSETTRPPVKKSALDTFLLRLKRTAPGYAPSNALELVEWVKDRICITVVEWDELLRAFKRDSSEPENLSDHFDRLCRIRFPDARYYVIIAVESLQRLCRILGISIDQLHPESIYGEKTGPAAEMLLTRSQNKKEKQSDNTTMQDIISQWLEFYGPVDPLFLNQVFGFSSLQCTNIISDLVSREIIADKVKVEGEPGEFICDSQNLERLFRMMRNQAKSSFRPLPLRFLQLFLAQKQQLLNRQSDEEGLKKALEHLFGYAANAIAWEQEILPTRIENYRPAMIDSLLSRYDLQWIGSGKKKVTFCLSDELNIMTKPPVNESTILPSETESLLSGTYTDLLMKSGFDSTSFAYRFWKDVWSGHINCDSFDAIRKGAEDNFGEGKMEKSVSPVNSVNPFFSISNLNRSDGFKRWKVNNAIPGLWRKIAYDKNPDNLLTENEINKQRVRQLLNRYGVLFRELLSTEPPHFQWSKLFKTLRIMELSGEIIAGHFFEEIPGIQFISASALQILQRGLPEDTVYRINATDPASLCSVPIPALSGKFPRRLISTHLFYHGTELVMISRKNGFELECFFSIDNPHRFRYLDQFKELALRSYRPIFPLTVQLINAKPVQVSEYLQCFLDANFYNGYKYLYYHSGLK